MNDKKQETKQERELMPLWERHSPLYWIRLLNVLRVLCRRLDPARRHMMNRSAFPGLFPSFLRALDAVELHLLQIAKRLCASLMQESFLQIHAQTTRDTV